MKLFGPASPCADRGGKPENGRGFVGLVGSRLVDAVIGLMGLRLIPQSTLGTELFDLACVHVAEIDKGQ